MRAGANKPEAGGRDVLLHALPLFHVHGLFVACHGALIAGAKQIFLPKLDPKRMLALLPRCTVMMGVPTYYVRLLQEDGLNADVCAKLRVFISGSAPLLTETFELWRERTGHTIPRTLRHERDHHAHEQSLSRRSGAAPRRHRWPAFARGECARDEGREDRQRRHALRHRRDRRHPGAPAPNVFAGYWRMPEKTREEFTPDGWFKTGDVGRFDADGYLSIVGRSKDLISHRRLQRLSEGDRELSRRNGRPWPNPR